METFSGLLLDLESPTPDQISIEDIAVGLAHTCRYSGQIKRFYSVAEHSVRVARLVQEAGHDHLVLPALMHDAHEAYLGDLTSMTKALVGDPYHKLADQLDAVIGQQFGFDPALMHDPLVKEQDRMLLRMESRQLQHSEGQSLAELNGFDMPPELRGLGEVLGWAPATARESFLAAFHEVTAR